MFMTGRCSAGSFCALYPAQVYAQLYICICFLECVFRTVQRCQVLNWTRATLRLLQYSSCVYAYTFDYICTCRLKNIFLDSLSSPSEPVQTIDFPHFEDADVVAAITDGPPRPDGDGSGSVVHVHDDEDAEDSDVEWFCLEGELSEDELSPEDLKNPPKASYPSAAAAVAEAEEEEEEDEEERAALSAPLTPPPSIMAQQCSSPPGSTKLNDEGPALVLVEDSPMKIEPSASNQAGRAEGEDCGPQAGFGFQD